MPPPSVPEEWKISPQQRLKVFNEEIIPQELQPYMHLHHRDDGKQPTAVLIVGQTGAGKTRLAPVLSQAMVDINRTPAHFIADTYKTYHPHYATCLKEAPEKASILTSLDARVWLEMACAYAVENRLDVLVESACRHPDDFCKLAQVFRNGGYNVRVAILAVPEALSRLGILVRYYRNLPEAQSRGLPLRLTPKKVHDDSYTGLAYAAKFLDEDESADSVIVVRRNNMLSYVNERVGGQCRAWRIEPGASKALEWERIRGLSPEERETARRDIEQLKKLGTAKLDAELREIEELMAPLGKRDGEGLPSLDPLHAAGFIALHVA
ncbi:zeta toxin-domain-containing protein [Podospora aff. communis PSN243]|uniref:Zeta toxin-domain-containing protein n=1 Tax=Podospora aff. communis PSN243 TaxID=3040156 RepID=A0AAV9H5L6_9PEZI|nr:zeta toxin-domain-containing protein [Podospora aff. communis PSN243]